MNEVNGIQEKSALRVFYVSFKNLRSFDEFLEARVFHELTEN